MLTGGVGIGLRAENGGGARAYRRLDEAVAVGALTAQRDEQLARLNQPTIHRRASKLRWQRATLRRDTGNCQQFITCKHVGAFPFIYDSFCHSYGCFQTDTGGQVCGVRGVKTAPERPR